MVNTFIHLFDTKLTHLDESKIIAGRLEIVKDIVNAINTHIDNPDVCKFGCGTIKNIVFNRK